MSVPARPTIVVADDRAGQAQLLLDQISRRFCGVAAATCVDSLRAALQEHQPDIAIVDVRMHDDFNILDLLPGFREISPATRFILWTGFPGWAPAGRAFALGVRGFLVKPVGLDELFLAIETVNGGRGFLSRDPCLRDCTRILSPATPLSPRQLTVFDLLRLGLTHARIARELGRSISTVENHVGSIRARLGISREPAYTEWGHITCSCTDDFQA